MLLFVDESGQDHRDTPYEVLAGSGTNEMGIIVFDELEKAQCRILIGRMERYFATFGQRAFDLRYVGRRVSDADSQIWPVYGITYIEDLRPKNERSQD